MSGPTFKLMGPPSGWGAFGTGAHDFECDAERRALCDHILRRIKKGQKVGNEEIVTDIFAGGMVAMAGLLLSATVDGAEERARAYEVYLEIANFAWLQAMSCGDGGGTVQ